MKNLEDKLEKCSDLVVDCFNAIKSNHHSKNILISHAQFKNSVRYLQNDLKTSLSSLLNSKVHLNTCLENFNKTNTKLTKLDQYLKSQSDALEIKSKLAESKLQKMLDKKTISSSKKASACDIEQQLIKECADEEANKKFVESELSKVEPIFEQALKLVNSISKSDIAEVMFLYIDLKVPVLIEQA